MTVTVRDNGARALVARMTDTRYAGTPGQRLAVDVGVIGERAAAPKEGHEGTTQPITVAMVAEWAELGLGQPRRSWLRDWVVEHETEIQERIRIESRKVIAGTQPLDVGLARIGVWMVGSIQARIAAGIEPPNAQSTIDRKGSSKPLIDTGQLRSSITSRVVRDA